jgi:hypothetical protein
MGKRISLAEHQAKQVDMRYGGMGLPRTVAPGRVLVHNHIRHGRTTGGSVNGFRWWTQLPEPDWIMVCKCGWAPELAKHYRVRPERLTR